MTTYRVIRFRRDGDPEPVLHGLTLAEAQAHCRREDTHGDGWFDGYDVDEEADECPAGGAHTWGLQEEPGTGRTGMACDECHAPMPDEEA